MAETTHPNQTHRILLVEDQEGEVILFRRTLKKSGVDAQIDVAMDGEAALKYLDLKKKDDRRTQFEKPSVIILDLNLPGIDGFEVLKFTKTAIGLRSIPVVVFTSSSENKDIDTAYRLGANSYLIKPMRLTEFNKLGELINQYWLERNTPPSTL